VFALTRNFQLVRDVDDTHARFDRHSRHEELPASNREGGEVKATGCSHEVQKVINAFRFQLPSCFNHVGVDPLEHRATGKSGARGLPALP
jgi:hypothetical protein